jgi:hypothetical protein
MNIPGADVERMVSAVPKPVAAALERKRKLLEERIVTLREEFQAEADEVARLLEQGKRREVRLTEGRSEMATSRRTDASPRGRRG